MAHRTTIVDLSLRLVGADRVRRWYRPLAIGRAVLTRQAAREAWWVPVSLDGRLRPRSRGCPRSSAPARGPWPRRRAAIVLLAPEDMAGRVERHPVGTAAARGAVGQQGTADIYGWCLLYQPPGLEGVAIVDPHDTFVDLPAYFELPLELLDRADFLRRRGVRSRVLALPTSADDFVTPPGGGPPRNRFHSP